MSVRALLAIACMATVVHAHPVSHDAGPQSLTGATNTPAPASPKERAAKAYFSERKLVTQHGNEIAFFSDALKGRVVIVNSFFTQCRDACPIQSYKLSQVQRLLGPAMGKDVHFVSITVDPERDSPDALNRYAAQFNAGEGWLFLTGTKENIDEVLRRLDQSTRVPEAHSTLFIAGNVSTGHWIKLHPDSTPEAIARELRQLAREKPLPADSH